MKKICCFLTGGILGAVAAILLTPRTGEQTRNMVVDYAGSVVTDVQEVGASAVDTIQSGIAQAQEKGAEVVNSVQGTAQNVKGAATDKNDELREKIEAARARIAAQMKQNAAAPVAEVEAEEEEAAPYESSIFVDDEDFSGVEDADDEHEEVAPASEWNEIFVPESEQGNKSEE